MAAGAVLFALGVHAARGGWLDDLPQGLVRRLGWTVVAGVLSLVTLFAIWAPDDGEAPAMGADLPTLTFALLDGMIAVAFALWVVAWLRGRWPAHGPLLDRAGRASYATYFIHPLVLTVVMMSFSSVPLAPEIKFVLVAAVAVPACFTIGYALTRVPGVSRVL